MGHSVLSCGCQGWNSVDREDWVRKFFGDGVSIHHVNLEKSCNVIGLQGFASFIVSFPLTDNMAASRQATVFFFFAILFTVEENPHWTDQKFTAMR